MRRGASAEDASAMNQCRIIHSGKNARLIKDTARVVICKVISRRRHEERHSGMTCGESVCLPGSTCTGPRLGCLVRNTRQKASSQGPILRGRAFGFSQRRISRLNLGGSEHLSPCPWTRPSSSCSGSNIPHESRQCMLDLLPYCASESHEPRVRR
jgi:hypothetical protein